jgi:hypothetical protein
MGSSDDLGYSDEWGRRRGEFTQQYRRIRCQTLFGL